MSTWGSSSPRFPGVGCCRIIVVGRDQPDARACPSGRGKEFDDALLSRQRPFFRSPRLTYRRSLGSYENGRTGSPLQRWLFFWKGTTPSVKRLPMLRADAQTLGNSCSVCTLSPSRSLSAVCTCWRISRHLQNCPPPSNIKFSRKRGDSKNLPTGSTAISEGPPSTMIRASRSSTTAARKRKLTIQRCGELLQLQTLHLANGTPFHSAAHCQNAKPRKRPRPTHSTGPRHRFLEPGEGKREKIVILSRLDLLPEATRNTIYGSIYHHSSDPNKGGTDWGKEHSADDPAVLINALHDVIQ